MYSLIFYSVIMARRYVKFFHDEVVTASALDLEVIY